MTPGEIADLITTILTRFGAHAAEDRWMTLADLRATLAGFEDFEPDRAQIDRILTDLAGAGAVRLAPDPKPDDLTQNDHDAALRLDGEERHLIALER